jgi:hypothetical protein
MNKEHKRPSQPERERREDQLQGMIEPDDHEAMFVGSEFIKRGELSDQLRLLFKCNDKIFSITLNEV